MVDETAEIDAIFEDDAYMTRVLRAGVRAALLDHKRTGDPIVVWRDGKVIWIPADQIVI